MAERSNAAVLKTVNCNRFGGSNPSLSAERKSPRFGAFFIGNQLAMIYEFSINVQIFTTFSTVLALHFIGNSLSGKGFIYL